MTTNRHTTLTATLSDIAENGEFVGTAFQYGETVQRGPRYALRIEPGAFAAQLADPHRVKILWQHDRDNPIGVVTEFNDTKKALTFKARIIDNPAVPRAAEALALLRDGVLDELSIGFDWEKFREEQEPNMTTIVHTKARLREISVVTFGALGQKARVQSIQTASNRQDHALASFRERLAKLNH